MHIFLPVAGISINVLLLVVVGGVVGVLSGLLGVGGGFLLTPLLMMTGVPLTIAAASGNNAIVATSSSGVAAHMRLHNVDARMGAFALAGALVGSAFGVRLMEWLEAVGRANLVITLSYIVLLGVMGVLILASTVRKWRGARMAVAPPPPRTLPWLARLPWQVEFPQSGIRHCALVPLGLCALVGVMTAVMGVGGGFMLVPVMVYLLGMPPHVAVGTSLFQILFTCMGVTVMQAGANHTVDMVLALLVAAGSTVGAQIGARMSRWLRGEQLMGLLGVLALAVMIKMTASIVAHPTNLLKKPAEPVAVAAPSRPAAAARNESAAREALWQR